jgi:hypothetical protein
MKFLKFDQRSPESKPEEEKTDIRQEGPAPIPYETDAPSDLYTGRNQPGNPSPYNCEPGHGIALVDVLRMVASGVRELTKTALKNGPAGASVEINWDHAFSVIEDAFKKHDITLVTFKDRAKPGSVPYYTKNTKNGIFFWVTPRGNTDKALGDAIRDLKANGMVAFRRENGIILNTAIPLKDGHPPEEVARFSKGTHVNTEQRKDGLWHKLEMDGVEISYKFDPHTDHMNVHCHRGKNGLIDMTAIFVLSHANAKQISKVLRYQAARFTQIFKPESYGLHAASAPFRLKKHVLIYCGDGKTIVVAPDDQSYLLTSKGEYPLCKPEGRVGLDTRLSFIKVQDIKTLNFTHGEVWRKFGHILRKRGLLV